MWRLIGTGRREGNLPERQAPLAPRRGPQKKRLGAKLRREEEQALCPPPSKHLQQANNQTPPHEPAEAILHELVAS